MKGRITKDGFEQSQLEFVGQFDKGKIQIHRDFIAHLFRWQHVVKYLAHGSRYRHTHLLDVGCGYDTPLYVMLNSNRRAPKLYTGVDIYKIREPVHQCSGNRNFLSHTKATEIPTGDYDVITCFEMLEHVPQQYAEDTLRHLYEVSPQNVRLFLSTPVYDAKVGAANNHINEMTRELLIDMFDNTGWNIISNYGTFASIKDYKPHLTEAELGLFNKLREYYHTDVLANIFAPLYPEYSRNNLWVCTK